MIDDEVAAAGGAPALVRGLVAGVTRLRGRRWWQMGFTGGDKQGHTRTWTGNKDGVVACQVGKTRAGASLTTYNGTASGGHPAMCGK